MEILKSVANYLILHSIFRMLLDKEQSFLDYETTMTNSTADKGKTPLGSTIFRPQPS